MLYTHSTCRYIANLIDLCTHVCSLLAYISFQGFSPPLSCTPTDYVYKGEVCKDTLLALKQCIFNQPPDNSEDVRINISTATDVLISERLSTIGVQYLQTLNPSQECVAELVPFLCQYLFTPCDERGVAYYPSSEDCVYIRDQVCAREWEEITRIPTVAEYLPNCESLPDDSLCNIGKLYVHMCIHSIKLISVKKHAVIVSTKGVYTTGMVYMHVGL